MKRTGGQFTPWSFCERCGFLYPLGELVSQKGLRVCTLFCFDNTDIEYRPMLIASVLSSDPRELVPDTPDIMINPEEIKF